jgi:ribonuclease VapC
VSKKRFVLDSFALLAYLEDEPGAEKVENFLKNAELKKYSLLMSMINWGEVYYSLYRSKGKTKAEESLLIIEQLPISIILPDRSQIYQAAKFKAKHSIAFADCFAAALASENKCKVLTGDPEFKKLENEIEIEWLSKKRLR